MAEKLPVIIDNRGDNIVVTALRRPPGLCPVSAQLRVRAGSLHPMNTEPLITARRDTSYDIGIDRLETRGRFRITCSRSVRGRTSQERYRWSIVH